MPEWPRSARRRWIGGGIEGVAPAADRRAACGGWRKRGGFRARAQLLLERLNLVLELLDLARGLAQFALEPVDAGGDCGIPLDPAGWLAIVIAVLRPGAVQILRLARARRGDEADKDKKQRASGAREEHGGSDRVWALRHAGEKLSGA